MAKFVPDSNTGQFLDDSGVRRDLWLRKIDNLEKRNKKLILDYTDNHFTKEGIVGDFYREIKDFCIRISFTEPKNEDQYHQRLG